MPSNSLVWTDGCAPFQDLWTVSAHGSRSSKCPYLWVRIALVGFDCIVDLRSLLLKLRQKQKQTNKKDQLVVRH